MVKSYETLVDSNTKVDVNTGIVAAGRLQSLIDSRDYEPRLVGDEGPVGPDLRQRSSPLCRRRCGERSSRSWRSWSSIRRRSTSARTPSMTLTTSPSIRPSSSTRTTSFDLRSARRHRGRWGPLPVWTGRSRSREIGMTLMGVVPGMVRACRCITSIRTRSTAAAIRQGVLVSTTVDLLTHQILARYGMI